MVADPHAAFERIKDDADHDKYETAEFLIPQYNETLRLFEEVTKKNPILCEFHNIPAVLIDTTNKTNEDVYDEARQFLARAMPQLKVTMGTAAGAR